MKKALFSAFFIMATLQTVSAQTVYDSKTLVDTNNNSTSTSTVNTTNTSTSTSTNTNNSNVTSTSTNNNVNTSTSTNTNNNINSGTMTYNNNNVNTGDMTNRNINTSTSTSTNTNYNYGTVTNNNNNVNTSTSTSTNTNSNTNVNQNVNSGDMTNRNLNDSRIEQKVIQPPPTAIAPAMMSGGNNDLCTTGTSGAVQTQILGVSAGGTVRDMNCERLKLSKTLYDMGMKVAAVSALCQDRRVFDAMWNAGTPCPFEGEIGLKAKVLWEANPDKWPKNEEVKSDDTFKKIGMGALFGAVVYKLFGF